MPPAYSTVPGRWVLCKYPLSGDGVLPVVVVGDTLKALHSWVYLPLLRTVVACIEVDGQQQLHVVVAALYTHDPLSEMRRSLCSPVVDTVAAQIAVGGDPPAAAGSAVAVIVVVPAADTVEYLRPDVAVVENLLVAENTLDCAEVDLSFHHLQCSP